MQDPFIQGFKDDLLRASKLLKTRTKAYDMTGRLLRQLFPNLPSDSEEEVSNPQAKDLSNMNSRIESAIVIMARSFLVGEGLDVGALVYDGLMVKERKKTFMNLSVNLSEALKELEEHIFSECGWRLKWVEKSMEVTDKD